MRKINLIAKTEKGKQAIKQHVEESMKMNRLKRAALKKTGFNQEVSNIDPYTLSIWASPRSMFYMAKPKHVADEIIEAMTKNNAIIDIDYKLEFEND